MDVRGEIIMEICVVGAGYVGLTSATVFADWGHNVVCLDIDEKKINQLKLGHIPIYEPGLEKLMKKNIERMSFTTDVKKTILTSSIILVAIGTPSLPDGSSDLSFLYSFIDDLCENIESYKNIIIKSTVPPGTNEKIVQYMINKGVSKNQFAIVSNPEFLREGSAVYDMQHPDRTVIGIKKGDSLSEKIMRDIYSKTNAPLVITSLTGAEITKYASNFFLATKISFINEMARICDAYQVEITDVAKGIGLDQRIGKAFLQAGLGYGGSCFPKDLHALMYEAKEKKIATPILEAVQHVNDSQASIYIDKLTNHLVELNSKTITILGLAFKPGTDDIRNSPCLKIINILSNKECDIRVYDPIAKLPTLQENIKQSSTVSEAIEGSDCVIIATEWEEIIKLDWKWVKEKMRGNTIVDGRNVLSRKELNRIGFTYIGVGRP